MRFKAKNSTKTTASPTGEITSANEENLTVPADYSEYYNKNNDFIGWIKIDGTEINYPVVQGDDNDYYLSHNFKKKKKAVERYLWLMTATLNSAAKTR